MSAKVVFAFCASALFVQAISGACLGSAPSVPLVPAPLPCSPTPALPAPALSFPALNNIAIPSSGGALLVTSASPFAPSGISILSEIVIEGVVAVNGALPFLSSVALEGQVPSGGSSFASYSCGDGIVGIVSENLPDVSYAVAAPLAPAAIASAYGSPLAVESVIAGPNKVVSNVASLNLASPSCGYGFY